MKNTLFILIFLIISQNSFSQTSKQFEALNDYVNFTNESVHGLLIIHRLLENYNQEVNKYVDLPNYKINNINNSDLPHNIFEDKNHWFYEITPYEYFKKIKAEKKLIGTKNFDILFPVAQDIFKTLNQINLIRFEISDFISKADLTKKEDLEKIYSKLEKAVDLYDLVFAYELNLITELNKIHPDKIKNIYINIYEEATDILLSVRAKKYENFGDKIKKLSNDINSTKVTRNRSVLISKKIVPPLKSIINVSTELLDSPEVINEYKLYGKDYYYYNIKLIDKYNRYGNGFVFFLNNYLRKNQIPVLNRFEYPHYYKVIYPKRITKKIETIKSKLKLISTIPTTLKGRKIEYCKKHSIKVDSFDVVLKFYDNKIQDGDIVSINFNGDWIYKKLSLETKPKEVQLKLNKKGKNYIILHAENIGRIPPNTIGIYYKYHGENQKVLLQSDLKTSEMLEFEVDEARVLKN